mmetsp:Transcript_16474/g.30156  ORF Transcript_16474/g.30156 Transcript_16474/m.30156 type:complete len:203 (-) Transcript_16474:519-1127(-)
MTTVVMAYVKYTMPPLLIDVAIFPNFGARFVWSLGLLSSQAQQTKYRRWLPKCQPAALVAIPIISTCAHKNARVDRLFCMSEEGFVTNIALCAAASCHVLKVVNAPQNPVPIPTLTNFESFENNSGTRERRDSVAVPRKLLNRNEVEKSLSGFVNPKRTSAPKTAPTLTAKHVTTLWDSSEQQTIRVTRPLVFFGEAFCEAL